MRRIALLAVVTITAFVYLSKFIKGRKGETPELRKLIFQKAAQWRLKPALVRAIIRTESNFNPRAHNPLDPSYGLMQITPGLAADYGIIADSFSLSRPDREKLYDPENNLNVGCWFMSKLINKYSFNESVQMYNVGESGYHKGVRNRDYLEKVRKYYAKYGG